MLNYIRNDLIKLRDVTLDAAVDAHQIATHKENVAENKYDTLGLEAAYLAHGQSQRVSEYNTAIAAYNRMSSINFDDSMPATVGALIKLIDDTDNMIWIFLGPSSGGVILDYEGLKITLVTPISPLGKALQGSFVGDDINVISAGTPKNYQLAEIY